MSNNNILSFTKKGQEELAYIAITFKSEGNEDNMLTELTNTVQPLLVEGHFCDSMLEEECAWIVVSTQNVYTVVENIVEECNKKDLLFEELTIDLLWGEGRKETLFYFEKEEEIEVFEENVQEDILSFPIDNDTYTKMYKENVKDYRMIIQYTYTQADICDALAFRNEMEEIIHNALLYSYNGRHQDSDLQSGKVNHFVVVHNVNHAKQTILDELASKNIVLEELKIVSVKEDKTHDVLYPLGETYTYYKEN